MEKRLREQGRVLLVSCYELGRQPLGLSSPKAALERAGFSPATLDLAVERIDDRIDRAALVAISAPMHTALRVGLKLARRIRERAPSIHLCFHGLYSALHAGRLLDSGLADSVVGGEGEEALVALAQALEEGRALPAEASWRGHRAAPVIRRLALAVPSRTGLPALSRYARVEVGGERGLVGAVEASRGCKHLCRHCPIPPVYQGRFFAIPVETILGDVDQLAALGAKHLTFTDPDFLNGPAHARRVVGALHQRHPGLTFDFTAKVEHLLACRTLLPSFVEAGALFVVTAAESLSDRVLGILEKGHTRADLEAALGVARAAGLTLRPTWLPFTPWSTREDYRELLAFLQERELEDCVDPVQLSIRLLVPSGSLLEKHPEMVPHLTRPDPEGLTWEWRHPDPGMDRLHHEASRVVAEAARSGEEATGTFQRLAELAGTQRGRSREAKSRRARAPRLTEPWFC